MSRFAQYRSFYQFRSPNGQPDYSDLNYWASHPWKWDPADSIPAPLRAEKRDTAADVFFLHPTTYTSGSMDGQNARIDHDLLNAKTDYSTILYQASAFNQRARIFAPRYRQAHVSTFFMKDSLKAGEAFDLAYRDIKSSFEYYLQHWNRGRPIIIAAHSQGSYLAKRLLREYFDGKKLQQQLVAAYVIGWALPPDYFSRMKACADSVQTACLCSWRSFKKGYIPYYVRWEKATAVVTNPLTWKTTEESAPRTLHRGSVLRDFNKLHLHAVDAQAHKGVLWMARPRFPGSFLLLSRNYHIGDINLFYVNLRHNVAQRISAYYQGKPR